MVDNINIVEVTSGLCGQSSWGWNLNQRPSLHGEEGKNIYWI